MPLCIFNFIFKFLPPLPTPCVKPKSPLGNSGGELVVGVGEATISTFDGNVLFRG